MTPESTLPGLSGVATSDDPAKATLEDGKDAAFRGIFERELPYVWNVLRRLGVPERDRPDVAQELFIAVARQLHTYDTRRPLRPWLFSFAFRCASDYRRRAAHRFELLAESESASEATPGQGAKLDETLAMRALLAKALDCLSDEARALVIMYEIEGWSIAEIAEALDVPLQTLYSRLKVARQELTTAVRRLGLREEGRR